MSEIPRVGADLVKRVIRIRAVDAVGKVVTNRPLPRNKFMAWCVQLSSG
jgi:transposase